ncbi:MAG: tetratricopeptide repeat protein, partial [Verrucomicrobiota bacterium]
ALKQAFAFCPYSPETVFNYSQLLATIGRYEDAMLVAKTCEIFDGDNLAIRNLVEQLKEILKTAPPKADAQTKAKASGPNADARAVFDLASAYFSSGQSNLAVDTLDVLLTNTGTKSEVLLSLVDGYRQLGRVDKVESALARYTAAEPSRPEGWYDLAAIQIATGRKQDGAEALRKALALSDARLAQDPKANDLRRQASRDPRLKGVDQPK